jgi:DNA-directed RNA polymerase specialized sigma24 family protein
VRFACTGCTFTAGPEIRWCARAPNASLKAMSPSALCTYRAERLLERDFHALRAQVLARVCSRLRVSGCALDGADLEACYASAWQGLYGATVRGEEIANPSGWLALVTYRRAIEELRTRRHRDSVLDEDAPVEPDVDGVLDDRARLRQLLEGMRCRLDRREREAAALCYLHGYSRAEAARLMGISELRMRKLMDGRAGRPGVAQKIGALVRSIGSGEFCRDQESLLRAFALGVLDTRGERHRIALAHLRGCPACRRSVARLRGLAAALPPVLALPGAPRLGPASPAAGHPHGPAGSLGSPVGASAAAGGGAAGSGWALGGGLGAKLAAGCLFAVGLGAGCAALERVGGHQARSAVLGPGSLAMPRTGAAGALQPLLRGSAKPSAGRRVASPPATGASALAGAPSREFTPEQSSAGPPRTPAARAAAASGPGGAPAPSTGASAARREFGVG